MLTFYDLCMKYVLYLFSVDIMISFHNFSLTCFCNTHIKYNVIILPRMITLPLPSWSYNYGSWIYNYLCNQYLSPLVLWVRIPLRSRYTTLCDKVCHWIASGRWFSPVFSTNKNDRHDITEIMLKVALNPITLTLYSCIFYKNN